MLAYTHTAGNVIRADRIVLAMIDGSSRGLNMQMSFIFVALHCCITFVWPHYICSSSGSCDLSLHCSASKAPASSIHLLHAIHAIIRNGFQTLWNLDGIVSLRTTRIVVTSLAAPFRDESTDRRVASRCEA